MGTVNPSTESVTRGPTSGIHRAATTPQKPLLASEVLREELAPLQPAGAECRRWLLIVAAALSLLGVGIRFGLGAPALNADNATIGFSAAGALAAIALLPFPYALRAGLSSGLAVTLVALGVRGAGPLAGLDVDGGWLSAVARMVALTAVPAALLLRARYRAYQRARHVLAAALVLSVPFVAQEAWLALDGSAALISRIGSASSVAVVACALFGFMGQGTTGLGNLWAWLVWLVLSAEIGLRQLTPLGDSEAGLLVYPATSVGVLCAAILGSLGLFQLLAAWLGPEARRQSLPSPKAPPKVTEERLNEPVA